MPLCSLCKSRISEERCGGKIGIKVSIFCKRGKASLWLWSVDVWLESDYFGTDWSRIEGPLKLRDEATGIWWYLFSIIFCFDDLYVNNSTKRGQFFYLHLLWVLEEFKEHVNSIGAMIVFYGLIRIHVNFKLSQHAVWSCWISI